eukprot:maker-scaffold_5-snap-gene-18.57-mRNA-1 protein AED:0.00 eAED:0.00 QI:116/1/1/1/1/1/2/49/221
MRRISDKVHRHKRNSSRRREKVVLDSIRRLSMGEDYRANAREKLDVEEMRAPIPKAMTVKKKQRKGVSEKVRSFRRKSYSKQNKKVLKSIRRLSEGNIRSLDYKGAAEENEEYISLNSRKRRKRKEVNIFLKLSIEFDKTKALFKANKTFQKTLYQGISFFFPFISSENTIEKLCLFVEGLLIILLFSFFAIFIFAEALFKSMTKPKKKKRRRKRIKKPKK